MALSEWRKDPVLDRWVVIATERGKRPTDLRVAKDEKKVMECPLCEHHEGETPPEVLAYREEGSCVNSPGWWVRVVPNKFPAVNIEGRPEMRNSGLYQKMDGLGAHEVVIENPCHGATMEDLNHYQVQEVIRAWRDRSLDLRRDFRFKYVQIFKNYGRTAGASLEHPHSQIIAIPMVPGVVREKMNGLTQYAERTGRCAMCEMIERELQEKQRVVMEGEKFICIAPFASRFPFEVWIIPREHQGDFGHISEGQIGDLAFVLRAILKKLSLSLEQPPFNLVVSTSPVNVGMEEISRFHWHIEIIPRLTIAAGFELGTGCYINPTPPEMAAAELRDTVVVYDGPHTHNFTEVDNYV